MTAEKLDMLASLRATVALTEKYKADFMSAKLAAFSDRIAEFDAEIRSASADASRLEDEIRAEVLAAGKSAKGSLLSASFSAGRVTWDGKMLDGLAIAMPEINAARKVGEPSVSIRSLKG